MGQDATWYAGRPRPSRHCDRWGLSSPTERGTASPTFGPYLFWPNGRPSQQLLSSCLLRFRAVDSAGHTSASQRALISSCLLKAADNEVSTLASTGATFRPFRRHVSTVVTPSTNTCHSLGSSGVILLPRELF